MVSRAPGSGYLHQMPQALLPTSTSTAIENVHNPPLQPLWFRLKFSMWQQNLKHYIWHFPCTFLGDKLADLSIKKKKKKLWIPRKIKGKVLGWSKSSPGIFCNTCGKTQMNFLAISIQKNKWGIVAAVWLVRHSVEFVPHPSLLLPVFSLPSPAMGS